MTASAIETFRITDTPGSVFNCLLMTSNNGHHGTTPSVRGFSENTVMPPKPRDLRERVMEKVTVRADGCWEWTGQTNGRGYGVIWTKRNQNKEYVHRLSYEFVYGPIPEGLEIDHLCRNRGCVNPAHLEAVTRRVNQLRGYSVSGRNARKTHCPKGHEFTPENTYFPPTGGRQCALCRREYRKEHAEDLREYRRKHYAENREKHLAYKRAWRARRKELGLPHE